uniref:CCHC-type domain-containing protein n=1 Tax=Lactuca sativa TaxID=4236 RepID=A0A9R1WU65_LACSA|nr:hypothetical protein LSAT_V11C900505860 [Lactuca sativa]
MVKIFNNSKENNSEEKQILTYAEDEDDFHANLLIKQDLLSRVKKIDLKIKKENVFKNVPSKLSILNPLKRINEIFYFEQINNNLKSIPVEIRSKIRMVHIGAVKILIKSQFQVGINSPIKMALFDNRITDRQDCILGAAKGNLAYQKFMFSVYPKFALDLKSANIDKTLSFIHHFERSDLMSPGDKPFTITYLIGYALTNSHHRIDYKKDEYIELDDVFSKIGHVKDKQFCDINPQENSWILNIARNKKALGETLIPRISMDSLHIGESSQRKDNNLIRHMSLKIDSLRQNIKQITDIINDLYVKTANRMTSIPELNRSTTSIPELNRSINLLNEKIDGLIINMDLTVNKYVTITQLEVASAKIIADITKELSEKINSCPCNKDILEHIKNISIIEQKTKPGKYSGLKKYSPPNPSERIKMKETISEQLEKYFFNLQYEDYDKADQKLIRLLSLETEECEELYKKEPKLFDQYFRMTKINEPDIESEQEDNFKTNTKTVKFEYSDMEDDEAESSYTATRRGNKKKCEFQIPVHNGIPNSGQGPNTINVLNIDCIQDLKLRERVVEKWVTEISLILQTNPDEFEKAKNILLLLEHKTDGIVQKFLRKNNWNEELHGLDYIFNKDFTINKKVDIIRVSMTKLQLHDISLLDKCTCMYESYLYDIPQRSEYAQWISAYLMKIPIIGETCTDRWKKEATGEIQQTNRYKQKKLKTISKDCCSILSDFKNFDIGKKNYTKKKYKNKKKYKSFWKKKRRKFSPGKYFKKPSKETPKKTTSCPQRKKKCRCWICNEQGHYANECPNRKKYPDKVKVLQTANNGGYEALEEEYDGIQNVFIYHVETKSSSDTEEYESITDDSD